MKAGLFQSPLRATAFRTLSLLTITPALVSTGTSTYNSSTLCRCLWTKPTQFNSTALATSTVPFQAPATTTMSCLTTTPFNCSSLRTITSSCFLLRPSHGTTDPTVKLRLRQLAAAQWCSAQCLCSSSKWLRSMASSLWKSIPILVKSATHTSAQILHTKMTRHFGLSGPMSCTSPSIQTQQLCRLL